MIRDSCDPARRRAAVAVALILAAALPLGPGSSGRARPTIPGASTGRRGRPSRPASTRRSSTAAIEFAVANENPGNKDLGVDLATTFGREPFDTPIGPVQPRGALSGHRHQERLRRRRVGRDDARRHDVQRDEELPVDRRRPDVAEGTDSRRHRSGARLHARRRSSSTVRTTRRSRGSTCCGRRATGRGPSGASRTGPIARRARRPRTGRIVR